MQPLLITDDPLRVGDLIAAARREEAGALVLFIGTVRNHSNDQTVSAIDYSAYRPMAESVLKTIRRECAQKWPEAHVLCHHRIGHLVVGDDAVVIVVSAPHRHTAFEACRHIIERLKEDCPIWKKEWSDDGASWVSPRP